jgi:hypothetical protein
MERVLSACREFPLGLTESLLQVGQDDKAVNKLVKQSLIIPEVWLQTDLMSAGSST